MTPYDWLLYDTARETDPAIARRALLRYLVHRYGAAWVWANMNEIERRLR